LLFLLALGEQRFLQEVLREVLQLHVPMPLDLKIDVMLLLLFPQIAVQKNMPIHAFLLFVNLSLVLNLF